MRIIKIAGKKIKVLFRINRKTGMTQSIPQEGYNPNHEGIERLLPTAAGNVTENDPANFPTQRPEEEEVETTQETMTF